MEGPRWRTVAFDAVTSTNDEARRLALAGDAGPVAVVARTQTAGRGRRGRAWRSPAGGLYASALVRPALPVDRAGLVPLAAGLALAEVTEDAGLAAELRWPNDVFVAGRKVGGVLCESQVRPDGRGLAWVVVGMGLNVASPPEDLAAAGATSLRQHAARPLAPADLLQPLLERLATALALAERDPPTLLAAWATRAPMLGREVVLATERGPVEGVAVGLAPTGGLQVRTSRGVQTVHDPDLVTLRFP